jgi:hypothetical protein
MKNTKLKFAKGLLKTKGECRLWQTEHSFLCPLYGKDCTAIFCSEDKIYVKALNYVTNHERKMKLLKELNRL